MNISYSSFDRFTTCNQMWKLHYIDRLRPNSTTSALFFGSAIGQVWQALALTKKETLTPSETKDVKRVQDWKKMYRELMLDIKIEGEKISPVDPRVMYYKGDYDGELMTQEDLLALDKLAEQYGMILPDGNIVCFEDLILKYPSMLSPSEIRYMNAHFYRSLLHKGEMMIESFIKDILPNITKVYSIEKEVKIDMSLASDSPMTDVLTGYMDLVCDFKVTDPALAASLCLEVGAVVKVLFDNKTSSARYGSKCLEEKPQLNIYNFCETSDYIGYIVGVKAIKRPKRGTRVGECYAEIQVVLGKANEDISNKILDGVNTMLDKVKAGNFVKNTDTCSRVYGKPCCYYDYCRNGSEVGLIRK